MQSLEEIQSEQKAKVDRKTRALSARIYKKPPPPATPPPPTTPRYGDYNQLDAEDSQDIEDNATADDAPPLVLRF